MANAQQPPRWYWIVCSLALIWSLFGLLALITDFMTSEAMLEQMSEAERELFQSRPTWLFAVYAVAIFSSLGGVTGLLLRRSWAPPLLILSLLAVVVQFTYVLFVLDAIGRLGAASALPFPLVILAIAIGLVWLALHAKKQGWTVAG